MQEHLVRSEGIERTVVTGRLVEYGEMRVAEERNECAWFEFGCERKQAMISELRG